MVPPTAMSLASTEVVTGTFTVVASASGYAAMAGGSPTATVTVVVSHWFALGAARHTL